MEQFELNQFLPLEKENEPIFFMSMEQEDCQEHQHEFFELVYITEGTCTHELNGASMNLQKGDYFIVDFGSSHRYTKSRQLKLINCLFLPKAVDDSLKGAVSFDEFMHHCMIRYYRMYEEKPSVNRIFHDYDQSVYQILSGMMKEYQNHQVGYREMIRLRLTEILILSVRNMVSVDGQVYEDKLILKALHYIHGNYEKESMVTDFCREQHYSLQYMSRRFKERTGLTMKEYQQKIRMEKCCEYLGGTDLRIAEIAEAVGYHDLKFFRILFQRYYHMSPSEYRVMAKSENRFPNSD